MSVAINWEKMGYLSGQAAADCAVAYYEPRWNAVVNDLDEPRWNAVIDDCDGGTLPARISALASHVILALQPYRPDDAAFRADCAGFTRGFMHGYNEGLIGFNDSDDNDR